MKIFSIISATFLLNGCVIRAGVRSVANSRAKANNAFLEASSNGDLNAVKHMLTLPGVNPTAYNNAAIRWASRNGHLEVVQHLLALPGVDPTADDNAAIRWASLQGRIYVVKHLLTLPGVDPTAGDNQAIRWAALNGHFEIVKELLSLPDVDPSAQNNEAIRGAFRSGYAEIVKLLLSSPKVKVDPSALESPINIGTHSAPKSELSMTSKMAKQLSRIGLVEKDIVGDGNCLFSSLSDQLFGDPSSQRQIRSEICNYIEVNEADFKSFLDENDESFETYLQRMKNDKTYGTNLELVAASRLYNRVIYVHQLGQPPWKIGEEGSTSSDGNIPLHILYHRYQHYSSLRNMDGSLPTFIIKLNGITIRR